MLGIYIHLFVYFLITRSSVINGFSAKMQRHFFRPKPIFIKEESEYATTLLKQSHIISQRYFFPGHGGKGPMQNFSSVQSVEALDLPELEETDNIHFPTNSLARSLEITSRLFKSRRSWYLVNGSTSGLLAAVASLRQMFWSQSHKNRTRSSRPILLVPRDSHKSIFDALSLFELDAILVDVNQDNTFKIPMGISTTSINDAIMLHSDNIIGLIVTRPSYQGLLYNSDRLTDLVRFCHNKRIPVVVDEAHGSHLPFLPPSYNIKDALSCGADIVVQSAHKTLTSLSQTALLHINRDAFGFQDKLSMHEVDEIVHSSFSSLTTTSPNSLLLASLDATISNYAHSGTTMVATQCKLVEDLKNNIRKYASDVILLLDDHAALSPAHQQCDPTRLSIHVLRQEGCPWDSVAFDDLLCEEFGIYCELNLPDCVTYVIPVTISAESLKYLENAILSVATRIRLERRQSQSQLQSQSSNDETMSTIKEMKTWSFLRHWEPSLRRYLECVSLVDHDTSDLIGSISGETISIYPPGIPFLIKGEVLQRHHIERLKELHAVLRSVDANFPQDSTLASGQSVVGSTDKHLASILVVPAKVFQEIKNLSY